MIIQPVNVGAITASVQAALIAASESNPLLTGLTVDRAEVIEQNPSNFPWVGIYKANVRLSPRTLGAGAGMFDQRVTLIIDVWAQGNSGAECEDNLENVIQGILGTLATDPSLGATVDTLEAMDVSYTSYQSENDAFTQEAMLTITAIMKVTAS